MTIMCMLASAVWGGSSSSAAICSNALAVLRSITRAVVTASDRASHNPPFFGRVVQSLKSLRAGRRLPDACRGAWRISLLLSSRDFSEEPFPRTRCRPGVAP